MTSEHIGHRERSSPIVLFVAGMPRSGSTLFDLMVGQLPGHCDVGELFYLWQAGPLRDQRCACGEHFSRCPFWSRVGEVAFGGWHQVDVCDVLALQARVDTTSRLPLLAAGRLLPRHAAAVRRYRDLLARLYSAVADVSESRVVVDSSKRPSTAFILAGDSRTDVRIAQVVRDPRGVVNSWNRQVTLPEATGPRSFLKRRPLAQIVRRWVTVNLMIELVARQGAPLIRFRYEDLVREPVAAMHGVLGLVGQTVTPAATAFLTPVGLSTGGSHAIAGGRVRMQTGTVSLRLDEAWRRELPGWRRAVTALLCGPLMRRYGYR